ncbi:MAG TPA: glutaredoxin family protein [Actinomycetota bacterium]|nr:glutaredoxin family protein [Actinomycetota bacterium]
MANAVTMYTTETCGHCRRLKRALAARGIEVDEVDVATRPDVAERIVEATGGYRVVPTVDVGGELLVNPSADAVERAVAVAYSRC